MSCGIQVRNSSVIVAYGPQENEDFDERNDFYIKLSIEIGKTIHAGEGVIVIGDFNAKMEFDSNENRVMAMSGNGKLLADMAEHFELKVMNFSNLCKGKWTWSKVVNGELQQSRLDYLLVSDNMCKIINNMEIDENKNLCPFHRVKEKGTSQYKIVYSDHP